MYPHPANHNIICIVSNHIKLSVQLCSSSARGCIAISYFTYPKLGGWLTPNDISNPIIFQFYFLLHDVTAHVFSAMNLHSPHFMQLYFTLDVFSQGAKITCHCANLCAVYQSVWNVHSIYGHVMVYLSRKLFGLIVCVSFYSHLEYYDKMSFCLAIWCLCIVCSY